MGYPLRVRVRVYPQSKNGYPAKLPIPVARVRVFAGKGMGTVENTHGLPMQFTTYTTCTLGKLPGELCIGSYPTKW